MTHRDPANAFDLAVTRAAHRAHQLAKLQAGLSQHEAYDRDAPLRRHRWWIEQTTGGETTVVAAGRALTKRAATRRKHRAYLRALRELGR